jgi:hypothetical protein
MTAPARAVAASVIVSVWLGAAALLATTVAPAAFAALPSRALAGDVVGRVLPVVFVAGIVVGLTAATLSWGTGSARPVLGAAVAAAAGVAQFVVAPRIAALRDEMGGVVDAVAADDPRRELFGQLHGASVALLGAAMLVAAVLLVLSLLALRQRSPEPVS